MMFFSKRISHILMRYVIYYCRYCDCSVTGDNIVTERLSIMIKKEREDRNRNCFKAQGLFGFAGLVLLCLLMIRFSPCQAQAMTKRERAEAEILASEKTTEKVVPDITPAEPVGSDLKILHTVTKLSGKRWIQSFAYDSNYYYYIQMINPYKGHLRLTRVRYTGIGSYTRQYMDLKRFGHGSNLDVSISGGQTWIWTGGDCRKNTDVSRSITAFKFRKGAKLVGHGPIRYWIPRGYTRGSANNVYPAISRTSKNLCVRFTRGSRQYFKFYKLYNGKYIRAGRPVKTVVRPGTSGDFQGFDIYEKTIYTIEGSPRKSFLRDYDKNRVFQPTIIRSFDYKSGHYTRQVIYGASKLSFREPEGIKIGAKRKKIMMYVSHTLEDQSANIYRVIK